jgi:hypothetical protein
MIPVSQNGMHELRKAMSAINMHVFRRGGVTLAKIARRSSWKREPEAHQLAGNVILRPLYSFDSTVGGEEPIVSSAGAMFSEEIKN